MMVEVPAEPVKVPAKPAMKKTAITTETPRAAWSVAEFCIRYSVSKGTAFALLRDHKIARVKIGRRTAIPVESADAWWLSIQLAS